ncbi:L,D-transpeptidase family protein [Cyanobium sp. N5-Cardenillas]|uniref:L,D-transpeptidase family protein n=1 Tax=Cyanobium sp. N5-Cardenillas TaxID=2823720 RepID=UPI0020CF6D4B|nr:L,D-transpeptidase family protein [Cyanobium sp. N5-Cardenillas]MCP9785391.1 hypothetical protein [Cyanobium sp. N5-Cardenillas]
MTNEVQALRPLLDLIYSGEGGPDSYNRGRAGDSPGPWPGGLQRLTIGEVEQLQARGEVFAVGQLQVTPGTMPLAIRAAGLTRTDRFDRVNQDRMAVGLILRGIRRRLSDYLTGAHDNLDAAQNDLALEWASIPRADGRGAYDGINGNKANPAKVEATREALRRSRAALMALARPVVAADVTTAPRPLARPITTRVVMPAKRPQDYGFKDGDFHLVVNDLVETCKAYNFRGTLLWELPALARGQGRDNQWNERHTDTPPGLYRVGQVYRDWERNPNPPYSRDAIGYGWFSLDLVELEDQERKHGRAGIMIHGGGSGAGWPGAWAPRQPLLPTLGCVRMHNIDLRDKVMPLVDAPGAVFVSVYQER